MWSGEPAAWLGRGGGARCVIVRGGRTTRRWPIIEKKLGDIEIFFRRLSSPLLDSRLAYTLLRSCGAPKANYLCMTHEPVLLNQFYTRMDHA